MLYKPTLVQSSFLIFQENLLVFQEMFGYYNANALYMLSTLYHSFTSPWFKLQFSTHKPHTPHICVAWHTYLCDLHPSVSLPLSVSLYVHVCKHFCVCPFFKEFFLHHTTTIINYFKTYHLITFTKKFS
jgi:hypothetical protein